MAFDWKGFLKPSKNKIFVAISLFAVFVPFIGIDGSNCMGRCPSPSAYTTLLMWVLGNYKFQFAGFNPPYLVAGAIVAYILALAFMNYMNFVKCLNTQNVRKINFHLGSLTIDLRTKQKRNRIYLILFIVGGPIVLWSSLSGRFGDFLSVIGTLIVLLGVIVHSPDWS
jgi:hypothetical protein